MSSRKRRRVPKKLGFWTKLAVYTCFLLIPTLFGGACGALHYLMPARRSFGESMRVEKTEHDTATETVKRCLTGAGTGAILGIGGSVLFAWASRPKKKKW